ncbi:MULTISPECIES: hypothetical protein [Dyella]|uniref:Uncharacterized protein n=2 Tax=Dyella TaxID=231454 RepID=A0A4R0YDG6_9GAMM|nr:MULTISPECIES: hypothetical protein [Dyella]TBR36056.1 hypothetical protein EYV96_15725 [Dyella terrae]TCI06106.1 hypothetical protein EZM97_34820 [Dyella soli]
MARDSGSRQRSTTVTSTIRRVAAFVAALAVLVGAVTALIDKIDPWGIYKRIAHVDRETQSASKEMPDNGQTRLDAESERRQKLATELALSEERRRERKAKLESMFSAIHGAWIWMGNDSSLVFDNNHSGVCKSLTESRMTVTFESLDSIKGETSGKYSFSQKLVADYSPPNFHGFSVANPQSSVCNSLSTNRKDASSVEHEEHGRLKGTFDESNDPILRLTATVVDCAENSESCSDDDLKDAELGSVQIIGDDRIKVGVRAYKRDQ